MASVISAETPYNSHRRYVIHLPLVAADLPAAQRLARVVGRWMTVLPMMDPGEMTVSEEDQQFLRHRVFCDLLLPGGRRCVLRADHDGECTRRVHKGHGQIT